MINRTYASSLSRSALAFVLAGGRGSRLMELTDRRAKPAVFFGGKSRIIDFALSNAVNSGIRRIGVATQYKAHSLIRHLQHGWNFLRPERNESFDILPASQRMSESQWYAGTADAVYQNDDIILSHGAQYIIVLAGDHVYKMDYEHMLHQTPTSPWAASMCRWPKPANSASCMSMRTTASSSSWKSRRSHPQCRAGPTVRSPAWASTCSR